MNAGSIESAIQLAQERWAQLHPFDLVPEVWEQLFAAHRPGDILYAIKKTKLTRDRREAVIYSCLLHWINLLEADTAERLSAVWPPHDVIPTR